MYICCMIHNSAAYLFNKRPTKIGELEKISGLCLIEFIQIEELLKSYHILAHSKFLKYEVL